jgi:chromosomal replication initiation ATPase DnaA
MKGDERILGDSEYVAEVLRAAEECLKRKYQLKTQGLDVDRIAERVAALLGLPVEAVWAAGKHRGTVAARSLLCYWSVRHLGLSMSSLAQRLGISPSAVSRSVARGEELAKKTEFQLLC